MIKKIIIIGSGSGSNARKICEYFVNSSQIKVAALMSNKPEAGFAQIASDYNLPLIHLSKSQFQTYEFWLKIKEGYNPDMIVLAGFLWLIPDECLKVFPRIINIHPSLLPKYGGKGMYGKYVHEAVLQNADTESGITIHFVNQRFDEGKAIAQFKIPVPIERTVESLSKAIHQLEHTHYSPTIEKLLLHEN